MANKIFSTYKNKKERSTKNNDRITVEIGHAHVACMVVGGNTNQIEDFEFFDLGSSRLKNFEESFAYVVIGSRLLDKPYADKKVFFNSAHSVLIPNQFYSKENAHDSLNLIFGNNTTEVFSDDLTRQFQIVNTYRVPVQVKEVVEKNLAVVTLEHTYTNLLKRIYQELSTLPGSLIKIQFYKNYFIVAVLSEHRLQYVQSLSYSVAEDVLYHLSSICDHFNLKGTVLQLSGMIDLKATIFEILSAHFKNIHIDNLSVPDLDTGDYPLHYFAPFFKLAE